MERPSLHSPVSVLAGVGKARAAQLEKLGIRTLYDLIACYPRAYEDRTKFVPICEMEVGVPACFRATVISYPRTAHIRKGLDITKFMVSDNTERLQLVFFNRPYLNDQVHYGEDYVFFGMLQEDYGNQLQNPQFEPASTAGTVTGRILPVYPLTAGLSNKMMVGCVSQALSACLPEMPDILPASVRRKYGLPDAQTAYAAIHAPADFAQLELARRRLVFEEFFIFSAGLALLRAGREIRNVAPWKYLDVSSFLEALPYSLTNAQKRALSDITADLASGHIMNRLIQGDVGSGKTAVAAAAAYLSWRNGRQSALMAPTEILAEQHAASLTAMLEPLGLRVVLLTGSMTSAQKRIVKERIASGEADLIIGTHALLTADVAYRGLGLVITDEQHRFGVSQRAALADKADAPHMLFLSATPIPRTLGLILYGDLDVSVIDELPPGRQPVDTYLVNESMRARINAFIRKHANAGNQIYIVCPAVEENEETDLKSAEVWAQTLQQTVFPELRVGLLHGQMKSAEKDEVMRRFVSHELDILVATTVIEVGVDVPNATLIVIEDADRFGLSQLHQLRGRVGRGRDKSYCVMFTSNKKPETLERLRALCGTNDGFRIAEKDLALRGPGDFFGSRQSGLPSFKVADLQMDLRTLQQAQEATLALNSEKVLTDPEYAPLLDRIRTLFDRNALVFN